MGVDDMLSTHGGKSKEFEWEYNCNRDRLFIENEDGRIHMFDLPEIMEIIDWLVERFGTNWFPLANNVQKLGDGTEKPGLGMAILSQRPKDITHAQGSSYLGMVLENVNIFQWNGAMKGIQWRMIKQDWDAAEIRQLLGNCA
jgi:hypothetical protein